MPLKSRRIDNNVAFSNPEIFEESGRESIVNDITFSATVGTLAQITLLSVYANDIFTKVSEEIKFASDRLVKLRSKFEELQTSVAVVTNFSEEEAEQLSRYDVLQELLLRPTTMSQAIFRRYSVVNDTPDYTSVAELLIDPSQYSPSKYQDSPDLILMKKFSDPNLFFRRWEGQQEKRLKAMREEREKTRAERKAQMKVKVATKRMTKVVSTDGGASNTKVPITAENSDFAPSSKTPLSPLMEAFGRLSLSPRSASSTPRGPAPFTGTSPVVVLEPIDSEAFSPSKAPVVPLVPDDEDDSPANMRVSIVSAFAPGSRYSESDYDVEDEEADIPALDTKVATALGDDEDQDSDDDIEVVDEEVETRSAKSEKALSTRRSAASAPSSSAVRIDDNSEPSVSDARPPVRIDDAGTLPTALRKPGSPKKSPKKSQVMFSDGPLVISDEEYERELLEAAKEEAAALAASQLSEEDSEIQRTIERASMAYGSRGSLIGKKALTEQESELQRSIERASITYGSRGSLIAKKVPSTDATEAEDSKPTAKKVDDLQPPEIVHDSVEKIRRAAFLEQVRSERTLKSASKLANLGNQDSGLGRSSLFNDYGRQSSIIFGVRATETSGRASISGRASMTGRASMDGRASMLVGSLRSSPPPRLTMIMREIGAGPGEGTAGLEDTTSTAIAGILANRPALPFSAADLVSRIDSKPALSFSAADLMKKIESRSAMPTVTAAAKEETRPALSFAAELMKKASNRSTKVDASGSVLSEKAPAVSAKSGQSKLLDQLVFGASKLKKVAPPNERKKAAPSLGGFSNSAVSEILARRKFLQAEADSSDSDDDPDGW